MTVVRGQVSTVRLAAITVCRSLTKFGHNKKGEYQTHHFDFGYIVMLTFGFALTPLDRLESLTA